MRRLSHSQHCHYTNVSIESTHMIEGAPVVHLNVLTVCACHEELSSESEGIDGSKLSLHLFKQGKAVAGSPDM